MTTRFLDVDDLDPTTLQSILERAARWKADPSTIPRLLEGQGIAALFAKPSLRTRLSFEMAVHSLGGHPIVVRGDEGAFSGRESPADVMRTVSQYCSIVAARVFEHEILETMAAASEGVPLINLLSDRAHPCQALADLLTLQECLGGLEGHRVAFVGDGNNVAASLALGAALTGLELVVSSPPGYELDDQSVALARNLGGSVELVADPHDAVRDCDAVYTDVWTSMGQETERERRRVAFEGYRVDTDLMRQANDDAIFLHCLPAHRGEEVLAEVIDGPASRVWQQAGNRMHTARALLAEFAEQSSRGRQASPLQSRGQQAPPLQSRGRQASPLQSRGRQER